MWPGCSPATRRTSEVSGAADRSGGAALETGQRGAAEAEGVGDEVRRGGGGRRLRRQMRGAASGATRGGRRTPMGLEGLVRALPGRRRETTAEGQVAASYWRRRCVRAVTDMSGRAERDLI